MFSRFWPIIDDALRRVAYENGVEVRLMASQWNHTKPDMIKYMRSLQDLNGIETAQDYHKTVKIAMASLPAELLLFLFYRRYVIFSE